MAVPRVAKLVALQHNCARGGQVMEAVLESAVKKRADLVLIQEPHGEGEMDSTRSHPSFQFIRGEDGEAAKCWVVVNRESQCQITERKDLTRDCTNYTQVLEVKPPDGALIIIINVYDRERYGDSGEWLAQHANWEAIASHSQVIITGDMNAHSQIWNGRATSRWNAPFWENLITNHSLVVWNSEEAIWVGGNNHLIIDLTLTSASVELNWYIDSEEATGSHHEVIVWEVLGGIPGSRDTSKEVTGWDISGWDSTGKSEEEQTAIWEKKVAAQQYFLRAGGKRGVLDNTSSAEQVEEAAVALQEAMVGTLNSHARRKRWCSRSKPWWTEDLAELRKELGRERRQPAGIGQARDARRNLRWAIRKAKKECWNRFLQEAKGGEVWVAASYTAPRLDRTGQALVDKDGNVAQSQDEREAAILKAHFPKGPPGTYEPAACGQTFERVDAHLIGSLLAKAANMAAPGDDRIAADILKVFWQWDQQRITQLVRVCIRIGYHPKIWKTVKGVVIPKPGKPDYAKVRAYRVISLLDVIGKLVLKT